jgi:glycosyltransferase involved in cell wall biosynthesis
VIATSTGGVPSLFSEHYDKDMLVPMNDPFYLASKVMELREAPEKAQFLSEENWKVAHERHNAFRIKKQLSDTYHYLCDI